MDQPDAYNINLTLNGQSTSATYTLERATSDMTKYAKILPASTNGRVTLGLNISQMVVTQDKTKIIDQVFNQDTYNTILSNDVLYYGNQTYYYPNGAPMWSMNYPGGYQLNANGTPVGGLNVSQDDLYNMAYDNTYGYGYEYQPVNNVDYTVQVSVPDIIVQKINATTSGKNVLTKDDNTTYLLMQTLNKRDLSVMDGINKDTSTFIPRQMNNDGLALIIKDDVVNDGFFNETVASYLVNTNSISFDAYGNSLNNIDSLRIRTVLMKNQYNYLKLNYDKFGPLLNYYYQNSTFSDMVGQLNNLKLLSTDSFMAGIINRTVNIYMSWAFQWYNASSGYFRNMIKETEAV